MILTGEARKVEPRFAETLGWKLRIEIEDGKKFFLLQAPNATHPAKLTSKEIASRQAAREQIIEQCSVFVTDDAMDDLFGFKIRASTYQPGEMPWLMQQAAKLFDEEGGK